MEVILYDLTDLTAGDDQTICIGNSVQLQASGGLDYQWTDDPTLSCTDCSDPIASPIVNTIYTVTITDSRGCVKVDEVEVIVQPRPIADAGPDKEICPGDTTQLEGSGGLNYTWSPDTGLSCDNCPTPLAFPNATTTYYLTVADALGCEAIDSMVVTVFDPAEAHASPDLTTCRGTPVQLEAWGGAFYTWTPATGLSCTNCEDPIANPDSSITYTVHVIDQNGCEDTEDVTITITEPFIIDVNTNAATCGDNNGIASLDIIGAVGPFTFEWSPDVSSSSSANNLEAGTYFVTVVDEPTGCTVSTSFEVLSKEGPSLISLSSSPTYCRDSSGTVSIVISGGTPDYEYHWDGHMSGSVTTSDTSIVIENLPNGIYDITIYDALDCELSQQIVVDNDCDCPDELLADDTICISICDFPYELCLELDYDSLDAYDIFLNGDIVSPDRGCAINEFTIYNYLALPGAGGSGPYILDSWEVSNNTFSATIQTMAELVDSMNVWDSGGNWILEAASQNIIGGNEANTYGYMTFTHPGTGFQAVPGTLIIQRLEPVQ